MSEFNDNERVNGADIVRDFLNIDSYNYKEKILNDETLFIFNLAIDNSPSITVLVTASDQDMVKIMTYLTHNVPLEKREELLALVNKLNDQFRLVKFSVDEDNSVQAQYDFLLGPDNGAAMEIFTVAYHLTISIINEAIPEIMKTVWS